ncbi:MAG: divalent-cation tolerance protein CutA [Methanosarcinales archaeon]|nr:divalent-cation tolerance protein CutA [Methanosarcinales archaeon]
MLKQDKYVIVYATFPSREIILKISKKLIQKKLVVCANIGECKSIYTWNGRVYEENEFTALLKTRADKWKAVKKFISKKHPYETPVILKLKIDNSNRGFGKWINESLSE